MRVRFAGSGDAFGSGGRWQTLHPPGRRRAGAAGRLRCHQPGSAKGPGAGPERGRRGDGDPSARRPLRRAAVPDPGWPVLPPVCAAAGGRAARHPGPIDPGDGDTVPWFQPGAPAFPGGGNRTGYRWHTRRIGRSECAREVEHTCGAPPLALRVELCGVSFAYSGDTQWTPALTEVARGADLFAVEAYTFPPPADPRGAGRAHSHVCQHAQQARRRRTARSLRRHGHRPLTRQEGPTRTGIGVLNCR